MVLRDEFTVQRFAKLFALAAVLFCIALMTVRRQYSEHVVIQYEESSLEVDDYQEHVTLEEIDPADLEIDYAEPEMIPYGEALERGYEDPVGFEFGDSK